MKTMMHYHCAFPSVFLTLAHEDPSHPFSTHHGGFRWGQSFKLRGNKGGGTRGEEQAGEDTSRRYQGQNEGEKKKGGEV